MESPARSVVLVGRLVFKQLHRRDHEVRRAIALCFLHLMLCGDGETVRACDSLGHRSLLIFSPSFLLFPASRRFYRKTVNTCQQQILKKIS